MIRRYLLVGVVGVLAGGVGAADSPFGYRTPPYSGPVNYGGAFRAGISFHGGQIHGRFEFGRFCDLPPYGYSRSFTVIQYTPPPVIIAPPVYVDPLGLPVSVYRPLGVPDRLLLPPAPPPVVNPPPANNPPANNPPAAKPNDDLEQRAEMLRQLRAGNEAFAEGNYALALRRYEQAVAAAPQEPLPYFHVAQAQLALDRPAEAVVAIQRGLRLHPGWPLAGFQPRALYRDRVGDYHQHLARLADAVGKNLNDDSLLFLLGYQLWFDGRRDEAVVLFQRAVTLALDRTFIDRFLKAAQEPGGGGGGRG